MVSQECNQCKMGYQNNFFNATIISSVYCDIFTKMVNETLQLNDPWWGKMQQQQQKFDSI